MKTKIIIAGIGGVGGYFGGLLAQQFSTSKEVEIYFLARGEHLKQIQINGLKVIKDNIEFIAKPKLASDNANEIGIADYIIMCTKSYDLENTIEQLKPCIDENTSILPLLNGVDSEEKIKRVLPKANIFGGCVYIVSALKGLGIVENMGNIQSIYFGQDNVITEELLFLERIFKQANIDANIVKNISTLLWEKFHLVGANSTATSYFNSSTGEILADNTKHLFLISLLNEVNQIALAKGILFEKNVVDATMEKLRSFPFATTSSMQRDFQKPNSKTELETITGYIVRAGQQLKIPTPAFERAYEELLLKTNI